MISFYGRYNVLEFLQFLNKVYVLTLGTFFWLVKSVVERYVSFYKEGDLKFIDYTYC